MTELHLYDFDGTLFRSPDRPDWWTEDWAYHPASLDVPCVPTEPGDEYWIASTVDEAKKSIADPAVLAVLVTGRGAASFAKWRVPELLAQKGLHFDSVHLAQGDTKAFKLSVLDELLKKHPDIDHVHIWEDHLSNLGAFVQFVESKGLVGVAHPVLEKRMKPICTEAHYRELVVSGWLGQHHATTRVAQRWLEARRPTDESAQYRQDIQDRAQHVKEAVKAFKELVQLLQPFADQAIAGFPEKDKVSIQRRGRAFNKAMKTNRDMASYQDTWIGKESDHDSAYSWRGAVVNQARDHLVYGKSLRDVSIEIAKQADKGFQAITMSQVQAPVRELIPTDLREFLPTNIVVEVDANGVIEHVTDRFENEHFTLGKKIERMHQLVADYNKIAKKVKRDLKSSDEIIKLSALITAILMETGIRPGKEGNGVVKTVDGEEVHIETFGAVTLGPGHVRFVRDNFVELEFLGKKTGRNTASLSDTEIIKVLDTYVKQALTKGTKYVFVTAAGDRFTYSDLQRYFRENLAGLAPTDFRKLKATEEVLHAIHEEQEALYARIRAFAKKAKGDLKERVVAAIVETLNTAIAKAQEALSHENANTTRRSYINPEIIFRFLSTGQVEDTLSAAILTGKSTLGFDPQVFVDRAMARTASDGDFLSALTNLLNVHSMENGSDTPDFILATYLGHCLYAYNDAVSHRDKWSSRTGATLQGLLDELEEEGIGGAATRLAALWQKSLG